MPAIFPRWTNKIPLAVGVLAPLLGAFLIFGIWYWWSPLYTDAGYRPKQPVPFSHALHAGDMGIDCRYCHNTVERSPHAAIPPTQTCMNCHSQVWTEAELLAPVRESFRTDQAIRWTRVHDLPDFVYFDHSIHLAKGVGCSSCHGRVHEMPLMWAESDLTMGWCLDCHRDPIPHLRPQEALFDTSWRPAPNQREVGAQLAAANRVAPREDCYACHR